MKKYIYEAKNYEEAQSKALAELNLDEQNVIIKKKYKNISNFNK